MDGILHGFSVALSFENVLFVVLGVTIGTIIGLLPGLGPVTSIALLLPLTFPLAPETAIIFLAGIYYGGMFGSRIPSILLNLPGDATSVVTTFDGYPLTQQGRAGPALGITAIGSFVGGTVAVVGLTVLAPFLASWAVMVGPSEMFALTLIGLLMIALISSGGMVKGLFVAGLGVLLATIGVDAFSGSPRFTGGSVNLFDGIGIVPLAVGLFGMSEVFMQAEQRFKMIRIKKVGRTYPTKQDWVDSRMAMARSSVLGFFIGIIPGGGGMLSSVIAYGAEKKFSKHPERFGKGAVDGLTATETADNASSNSSFIPLLTLGIPPNPVLAIIAGALILHGVSPGPQLITEEPDIFWGVIASMYIGCAVLLILNLPLVGLFVKMLSVPTPILMASIVAIAIYGVYSVRNNLFDVGMMFIFAVVGYILRKVGLSSGPLILGFILAPIMETNFRRSMILSGGSPDIFINRPATLIILLLAVILLAGFVISSVRGRKSASRKVSENLSHHNDSKDASANARSPEFVQPLSTHPDARNQANVPVRKREKGSGQLDDNQWN